ncbi:MAG: hypothetical protein R3E31_22160 [Chloroflexota bacterium]
MNDLLAKHNHLDVFDVADFLVSRAVEAYGEEIDIIAYYGSYAQGRAKATSDLDIFYIPAEGKNPPVGRTFLVEGLLFDFWAIGWGTLEGFATGQVRGWSFAPAIVHYANVLYARSDEQSTRFAGLKEKVLDLQKPEAKPHMIERALDKFKLVLVHWGNLRLALAADDVADVRNAGWELILAVWECLALANQTFFERGWGNLLDEIPRLSSRPAELEPLIVTISTAEDAALIADAAEKLVLATRQILRDLQLSMPSQQTAKDVFTSSYPEIKDGIRKVLTACERQRPISASVAAWAIQHELAFMLNSMQSGNSDPRFNLYSEFAPLYRQLSFPDLMGVAASDLTELSAQAGLLDERIRQWLGEQSVDLCEFDTFAAFKRSV